MEHTRSLKITLEGDTNKQTILQSCSQWDDESLEDFLERAGRVVRRALWDAGLLDDPEPDSDGTVRETEDPLMVTIPVCSPLPEKAVIGSLKIPKAQAEVLAAGLLQGMAFQIHGVIRGKGQKGELAEVWLGAVGSRGITRNP